MNTSMGAHKMPSQKDTIQTDQIKTVLGFEQESRSFWEKYRRIIWGTIIGATLFVGFMLWGFGANNPSTQYKTESATSGNLTILVTATGKLRPTNTVDISSELSGTIRKVLVDYNSNVTRSQVLAELDTDRLEASVASSVAKLLATKAKVRNAEATVIEKKLAYERALELFNKKVGSANNLEVSKAAYERALAGVQSAEADVAAMDADLRLNKINLAKSCICSPINGIVLKRNVEPGQTVASSLQAPVLFTIAEDLTKMEVQVDVDEADVGKVSPGQRATFTVDAYPNKEFTARIRELYFGSEIVQGVVTYKAILTTNNSSLLLRPGMTATAEIVVQEVENSINIPNAALRFSPATTSGSTDKRSFIQKLLPGRPSLRPPSVRLADGPERKIWVLEDGQAQEMVVTIGVSDGRQTQIVKGDIKPGQNVIVDTSSTGK